MEKHSGGRTWWLSCLVLLIASGYASAPAFAQAQGVEGSAQRKPLPSLPGKAAAAPTAAPSLMACLILPARVADIGSPVVGVVASVEVERGDFVRKGQVLARLRADVEQANSGVARSRADSEAEWRGAVASQDLARIKLDRARSLKEQNFVSGQAVEQAESEYRIAAERAAQVREQLQVSSREASSAMAQLSQRTLRAPFDGVVTERYANPGERFEDKPLLKIADIARLRVDVVASTGLFGNLKVGQDVTVQPELPGFAARLAQISQIDRVLDPASNTFRVRLDLPNPASDLPAGLRCKAELGKSATQAAAPGSTAPSRGSAQTAAPAPAPTVVPTRTATTLPAADQGKANRRPVATATMTASAGLPAPAARPPSAPLPSMQRLIMDLSPLTEGPAANRQPGGAALVSAPGHPGGLAQGRR